MSFTVRPSQTRTQTRNSTNTVEDSSTVAPEQQQRLWVLVGVIGSGKSHLADAIATQVPNWTRVCQDVVGSRKEVIRQVSESLSSGKHVIVDRQNFDADQRSHWIRLARSHQVQVTAVVFNTSSAECHRRLQKRTDHETIATPEDAVRLHDEFLDRFEDVESDEGFDRIYNLPANLPYILDIPFCMDLIRKVDAAPSVSSTNSNARPPTGQRGSSSRGRGARGSSRGRGNPQMPWAANASDRPTRGTSFNRPSTSSQGNSWGQGNRLGTPTTSSSSRNSTQTPVDPIRAQLAQAAEARLAGMAAQSSQPL